MKQKTLFSVALTILLLVFTGGAFYYSAQQEKQASQVAEANRAALIRMHSPTLGKAEAPVVIVEFLDPACETCRAFYPRVKQLLAANPDKIRLVLRYAPFHNGSDKIVALLEAARMQGKFWPVLEALLASQADWAPHHTPQVALAWPHLEGLGLNMEQMAFDLTSPDIAKVIEQDLADARTLNVTMTPEFFVNGKPLPSFGFEQLQQLVDAALAATRGK
ncbi:MAG: thioredoxin domain-containing protein [Dechloromonas sp.]|nr:thioredoxin domain-containing protein [Dechloromonas sp.]